MITAEHPLACATAPGKESKRWKPGTITWAALLERLQNPASEKECGGFVLGEFRGDRRTLETLVGRDAIVLDADSADADLAERVAALFRARGWACALHWTYSSTRESPRWHIIVPLSRRVNAAEYEQIALWLLRQLGTHQFDVGASTSAVQFMYWPATSDAAAYEHRTVEGDALPADQLLVDIALDEPEAVPAPVAGYDGPAYVDLTPAQRAAADTHVAERIESWRRKLEAAVDWPEGERDEDDRGWEALARDWAWAVASLAVHPGLNVPEPEALYREVLPSTLAADEKCRGKWSRSLLEKAAKETAHELPRVLAASSPEEDFQPVEDTPVRESWTPVDVLALLDGGMEPLQPTMLARTDGVCLLYPGRTHSVSGESGSGKSWLAQWAAAQVLRAGEVVLYLDYESSAGSVVARLQSLGCSRDDLSRFVYVNPDAAPKGDGFEALLVRRYALAVVDGVTEALGLSGLTGDNLTNSNDAVTRWHAMLPKRIATETGAAVLQVDHVTKAKDNRGGYAIGGQAKRAAITGAAYVVTPRESFGRGRSGSFDLYVSKDREGWVLGALEGEDSSSGRHVARVTVECTGDAVELVLQGHTPASVEDRHDALKDAIMRFLGDLPPGHPGASGRLVRDSVKGTNEAKAQALAELVAEGYVVREPKGQSMLHRFGRPFTPFEDEEEVL